MKIRHDFGVSPAFYISAFGSSFTIDEVCKALHTISKLGFNCFQTEVYYEDRLDEWLYGGSKQINQLSKDLNIKVSQFVAHFMLDYFTHKELLFSNKGYEEMKKIIDIVCEQEYCKQITVPLGPFHDLDRISSKDLYECKSQIIDKLAMLCDLVNQANLKMALEILPNAIISISEDVISISEQIKSESFGINFDTGHAWVSGEDVVQLPLLLKNRIFSTHLCDNFGTVNLSLQPGKGNIPWESLIDNLVTIDYKGSYDIEIHCTSTKVEEEYASGKAFIQSLLKESS